MATRRCCLLRPKLTGELDTGDRVLRSGVFHIELVRADGRRAPHPIEADEIATLVAYLCDPANVSIAGECIVVSGGAVIV